jgi:hypothetical protein
MLLMNVRATRFAGTTLLALIVLAGCGGGDTPPAEGEMAAEEGMAEMDMPSAAPAGSGQVQVQMSPIGDFLSNGTLTLTRSGTDLRAEIHADSRLGPGDYLFMIHQGRCAAPGAMVVTLTTMTGAEGGDGMSVTTFPASQLPLTGEYALLMHRSDGTPIACGDFPSLASF